MHLIHELQKIFRKEKLEKLANGLRPYSMQSTSSQSGIMEAMTDAFSIDSIKRRMLKMHNNASMDLYYRLRFRDSADGALEKGAVLLDQAKEMCMCSVAAYAIVQYLLQLKDRHNGNILIDSYGRMVHIDYAFMLGWAPGGITFERPAFKLTQDIVDVWGGRGSPLWNEFVELMVQGLHAAQMHWENILHNVEIFAACGARFPCLTFTPSKRIIKLLRQRFKLHKSKQQFRRYVISIIDYAYDNFWTNTYAKFQLLTNGVVP